MYVVYERVCEHVFASTREFTIRAVGHCPLTSTDVYCRTLAWVIGAAHHLSPILWQAYKQVYCKPCSNSVAWLSLA